MSKETYRYEGTGLSLASGGVVRNGDVIAIETNEDGQITDTALAPFAQSFRPTDDETTVEYDPSDADRSAGDLPPGYNEGTPPGNPKATHRTGDAYGEDTPETGGDPDASTESDTSDVSDPDEADTSEGAQPEPLGADGSEDGSTADESDLQDVNLEETERDELRDLASVYDDVDGRQSNAELREALAEKQEQQEQQQADG